MRRQRRKLGGQKLHNGENEIAEKYSSFFFFIPQNSPSLLAFQPPLLPPCFPHSIQLLSHVQFLNSILPPLLSSFLTPLHNLFLHLPLPFPYPPTLPNPERPPIITSPLRLFISLKQMMMSRPASLMKRFTD